MPCRGGGNFRQINLLSAVHGCSEVRSCGARWKRVVSKLIENESGCSRRCTNYTLPSREDSTATRRDFAAHRADGLVSGRGRVALCLERTTWDGSHRGPSFGPRERRRSHRSGIRQGRRQTRRCGGESRARTRLAVPDPSQGATGTDRGSPRDAARPSKRPRMVPASVRLGQTGRQRVSEATRRSPRTTHRFGSGSGQPGGGRCSPALSCCAQANCSQSPDGP
jgi:hypothetical protein